MGAERLERLGGWKTTIILKHANATGRNRKDAKYMNKWAADPAENQTQEQHLLRQDFTISQRSFK